MPFCERLPNVDHVKGCGQCKFALSSVWYGEKIVLILHCAIDKNEFNHVCQCKSAKEILKLFEITHEGTNQVKECKVNILVHDYELFSMKDFESIVEMFSRFMVIVNELESLGKTCTKVEKVMKILTK